MKPSMMNDEPLNIAVAMMAGLDDTAFSEAHWERLATIGSVLNRTPLRVLDDDLARATLARADVLLGHWGCPTLTTEVLSSAPRLRMFAYAAGTVKWQLSDTVWERTILVTSAAAANAVPVAEYTTAMILLANKGALLFRERLRNPDAIVTFPTTLGNVNKRVGIIGASFVGRKVIELLGAYQLHISLYDPYVSAEDGMALGVDVVDDLTELCATSDVVSLHAPDVKTTRGMLGARQFAAMRDGTVFINTARPAIVDQVALLRELQTGRIAAVLDVTSPEPLAADHPLLALPNVVVTPHVAGSIGTELARMADLAIDEIERFAHNIAPLHAVTQSDLDRIA